MIAVNLSIDQLAEAVRNLDDKEKSQLLKLLTEDELTLSPAQQKLVLSRSKAYDEGDMPIFSIDELKARLNYPAE
jgi:hypothetical protein